MVRIHLWSMVTSITRHSGRWRWLALTVACLVAGSLGGEASAEDSGHRACVMKPSMEVSIGAPIEGLIKSVHVERGDWVSKGQAIVVLESSVEKASVDLAKAKAPLAAGLGVSHPVARAASMLAESIHSIADTGNQALLLLGSRRAAHAPTAEHPFGFGRERYFWAFVVALVLFSRSGSRRSRFAPRSTKPVTFAVTPVGGASFASPRRRSCRSCCSRSRRLRFTRGSHPEGRSGVRR